MCWLGYFGSSTLGQVQFWLNENWPNWMTIWTISKIRVNPTYLCEDMGHPGAILWRPYIYMVLRKTEIHTRFLTAESASLEMIGSYMRALHRSCISSKVKWHVNLTPRCTATRSFVWKRRISFTSLFRIIKIHPFWSILCNFISISNVRTSNSNMLISGSAWTRYLFFYVRLRSNDFFCSF